MNTQIAIVSKSPTQEEINDLIIDSIQDIKGKDIVKLDLRQLDDAPTDYFIICSGESVVQVKGLAENVNKRLKLEIQTRPLHIEGQNTGRWVCMDYFNTVVHIFYKEAREFYELEQLWSDAIVTEYETL